MNEIHKEIGLFLKTKRQKKNLTEEKIDMQNGFIQEIENTSKKDVKDKKEKINNETKKA